MNRHKSFDILVCSVAAAFVSFCCQRCWCSSDLADIATILKSGSMSDKNAAMAGVLRSGVFNESVTAAVISQFARFDSDGSQLAIEYLSKAPSLNADRFDHFLSDSDSEVCIKACEILRRRGEKQVDKSLGKITKLLGSDIGTVRAAAARTLAVSRDKLAFQAIAKALRVEKNMYVSFDCVRALTDINRLEERHELVDVLIDVIIRPPEPPEYSDFDEEQADRKRFGWGPVAPVQFYYRDVIIAGLSSGGLAAIPKLESVVSDNRYSVPIRAKCLQALASINRGCLDRDKSEELRHRAATLIPKLVKLLSESDPTIRIAAAITLGSLEGIALDAVDALTAMSANDPRADARVVAERSARRIRGRIK